MDYFCEILRANLLKSQTGRMMLMPGPEREVGSPDDLEQTKEEDPRCAVSVWPR